jgi:selenide,water dikinase
MGAIESMLQSSHSASEVLIAHGATTATDVTGFGLLGHLTEMLRASKQAVSGCDACAEYAVAAQ